MPYISFEEVKEIFKKSIDETTNINEALEKTVQCIYSKGYEDGTANTFDWDGFNEKAMNCEWCDGCIYSEEDDGMCYDCARCSFDYYETEKDREAEKGE